MESFVFIQLVHLHTAPTAPLRFPAFFTQVTWSEVISVTSKVWFFSKPAKHWLKRSSTNFSTFFRDSVKERERIKKLHFSYKNFNQEQILYRINNFSTFVATYPTRNLCWFVLKTVNFDSPIWFPSLAFGSFLQKDKLKSTIHVSGHSPGCFNEPLYIFQLLCIWAFTL